MNRFRCDVCHVTAVRAADLHCGALSCPARKRKGNANSTATDNALDDYTAVNTATEASTILDIAQSIGNALDNVDITIGSTDTFSGGGGDFGGGGSSGDF